MHFVKKWISIGFFLFGYFPKNAYTKALEQRENREQGWKGERKESNKGKGGKGKREGGSIRMRKTMNE